MHYCCNYQFFISIVLNFTIDYCCRLLICCFLNICDSMMVEKRNAQIAMWKLNWNSFLKTELTLLSSFPCRQLDIHLFSMQANHSLRKQQCMLRWNNDSLFLFQRSKSWKRGSATDFEFSDNDIRCSRPQTGLIILIR